MRPRDFIIVPATAIAVMALNVAISFFVVWVYSLVDPGHADSYYETLAMRVAPISSVIAGIPLMFLAGFLLAGRRSQRSALLVAGATALFYNLVDTGILLAADAGQDVWPWAALSYATKLLSALAGAWFGMIRSGHQETGASTLSGETPSS